MATYDDSDDDDGNGQGDPLKTAPAQPSDDDPNSH